MHHALENVQLASGGLKYLHLFSINWCRIQDFPVPALPITRNLNRKSERQKKYHLVTTYGCSKSLKCYAQVKPDTGLENCMKCALTHIYLETWTTSCTSYDSEDKYALGQTRNYFCVCVVILCLHFSDLLCRICLSFSADILGCIACSK